MVSSETFCRYWGEWLAVASKTTNGAKRGRQFGERAAVEVSIDGVLPLCSNTLTSGKRSTRLAARPELAVRPEGADHRWRKIPPGELSIDPVADERLGRVIGRAGAS